MGISTEQERLFAAIRRGDLSEAKLVAALSPSVLTRVSSFGRTVLGVAFASKHCSAELIRWLFSEGADIRHLGETSFESSPIREAVKSGDVWRIQLAQELLADVNYITPRGYNAAIDAAYASYELADKQSIEVFSCLQTSGVKFDQISSYGETTIRTLTRFGRFKLVKFLIESGVSYAELNWSPLHRAAALGDIVDIDIAIAEGWSIEQEDRLHRTPFHYAVLSGRIAHARRLLAAGANKNAWANMRDSIMHFAAQSQSTEMLEWVLEEGVPVDAHAYGEPTALANAVEIDAVDIVRLLINKGARLYAEEMHLSPVWLTKNYDIARLFYDAGDDLSGLSIEGRRALIGVPVNGTNEPLYALKESGYTYHRREKFGRSNPERVIDPFWLAMIRSGLSAYAGRLVFGADRENEPTWCADRFGQSKTFLPDGRLVLIAGEHEDSYDHDFCIYNDVFVIHPDGQVDIFCYPKKDFANTDFHTAIYHENIIWIVGNLGYSSDRAVSVTPVYRLNTLTWCIQSVVTSGENPGWISRHTAKYVDHSLQIVGGDVLIQRSDESYEFVKNSHRYQLCLRTLQWKKLLTVE